MKRIFITGMSGVGKSSVLGELRARGFATVDTDFDDWCVCASYDGTEEWILRADRLHDLLSEPRMTPIFVSGCRSNQREFYHYFDHKVLLSAPVEVLLQRVKTRENNPYGKSTEERDEIRLNFEMVQPLLERSADYHLDSSALSVNEVANFLVRLVDENA